MIEKNSKTTGSEASLTSVVIPRLESVAAKRALQEALDLVQKVHSTLPPGGASDRSLDLAERRIREGITLLRDADRTVGGFREVGDVSSSERLVPSAQCLPPKPSAQNPEPVTITCPRCGTEKKTTSKTNVACLVCRYTWQVTAKAHPRVKRTDGFKRLAFGNGEVENSEFKKPSAQSHEPSALSKNPAPRSQRPDPSPKTHRPATRSQRLKPKVSK